MSGSFAEMHGDHISIAFTSDAEVETWRTVHGQADLRIRERGYELRLVLAPAIADEVRDQLDRIIRRLHRD